MARMIWKNGLFLPESEARMSVYDEGALYGTTVFEMMRTFNKQPFRLDAHIDRLIDSCRATYLPLDYSFKQLKIAHEDLLARNRHEFADDDEIRTMINVSRGVFPIYRELEAPEPYVMMTAFPLRWVLKGVSQFYRSGLHAIIAQQRTIPAQYLDPKVKNRSRLHYRLAELEVKRHDAQAWPILLDESGFIAESTGANVFTVKGDRLFTPEPRNCLRGISRNFVLWLAREHRIDYRERNLEPYDLLTADEAFFTATPWCIMPITRVNYQKLGWGRLGRVTEFLIDKWVETVECDFVEQTRRWDASRT